MKNQKSIKTIIRTSFVIFWALFFNISFAEDNDEVILLDEIVIDTENIEEKEKKHEKPQKTKKTEQKKSPASKPKLNETSESLRAKIKESLATIDKKLTSFADLGPNSIVYTVKSGDTLSKIADEFNTSYELIMRLNEKFRTNIRIGERLKVVKGPFDILVDKSDFTLTLLLNNRYIKQYNVGLGKNDKTPVGEFEIEEKMEKPVWYSGDGVYPFGHPKNILGTRWIGFKDKQDLYGYGIHGTADPDSIGKSESNGCIRLKNSDVEDLYAFVTSDTKVTIQE